MDIIDYFNLELIESKMIWVDEAGRPAIICNNNKNSYYYDNIGATVYIREDLFRDYTKKKSIKFFAFTERYIDPNGFSPNTSIHFELNESGKIIKEILNNDKVEHEQFIKPKCLACNKLPRRLKNYIVKTI